MDTGSIRKWHIGLGFPIFTAIMVAVFLSTDPPVNPRTTSPMTFEMAARGRPLGKTKPHDQVWDVTLYPAVEGVWTVNFLQLTPKAGQDAYEPTAWTFTAKTPYNGVSETIPDWLKRLEKDLAQQNRDFKVSYAWWREPLKLWSTWGVLSTVIFTWGFVIPVISWLASGGLKELAAKPQPPAPDPTMGGPAVARAPTAADHNQLDEMLDRLETTVGAGANPTAQSATATGPHPEHAPAPALLTGKPLEASPDSEKEEEKRDYKGEFYPVARAGPGQEKKA